MWAQAYSRAYSDALGGSARGRAGMTASRHRSDLLVAPPSMKVLSRQTSNPHVISLLRHRADFCEPPCMFCQK